MENLQIQQIAQRLRDLRLDEGKSIESMMEATDTTFEQYMNYEEGKSDFTFTFLHNCAKALGVDITVLISGEVPRLGTYAITRSGEGLPLERRQGFNYRHMAALFKSKLSEPFYVTARYNEQLDNSEIELSTHEGEEFDYILKGTMKARFGNHIEILHAGDSVYYNSGAPHGMIATGGKDCEFLAIVMKPAGADQPSLYQPHVQSVVLDSAHKDDKRPIYDEFVKTVENENGELVDISFTPGEHFNFGFDIVDKIAEKSPDKLAMVWVSHDKKRRDFTFSDMSRYSNMTANYFKSLGIKKGDRVMLVLKRHYQFWFSILALHKLGAVVIPATNMLVKKDFEYRFNAGDISAVVCTADGDVAHQVDLSQESCPQLKTKILVGGSREGWHDFHAEFERCSDRFDRPVGDDAVTSDDVMLMFFTSGTTGYPKIACHSFTYPLGHLVTAKYWHNVDPAGLHFTISDTGWGKALWGKLYGQWLCEAAIFTYDFDKFNATDILPMFKEYNITTFCAPPTMYRFFIKEDLSKYDLSSLKYTTIAGEALNPEVYNQFYKATGLKLMEGFGQTETTLTVANLAGMTAKPGSMGKPSPQYDIDLINAEGKSAKVGEVGEIVVRTDRKKPCGLFCGYYGDQKSTDAVWHDGMYHTGDTAWRDEDGYFWYVGRTDDLIKSSGYRIGPFEIESVIMELPYVLECAVTGVPDPIRGQVVKATIVAVKGTEITDELIKDVQNYVKSHTAPYKYPRVVEFVDELPKTISGKIRRVELR